MSDIYKTFFSPFGKEACIYFLIITIFSFFTLVVSIILGLIYVLTHYKNIKSADVIHGILIFVNLLLSYFVTRLLYSMCVRSLQ